MAEYIVQVHSKCIVHNLFFCLTISDWLSLSSVIFSSGSQSYFFDEHCVTCKFKDDVYIFFAIIISVGESYF